MTKAAIQITFNAYIEEANHGQLLGDVMEDTRVRYEEGNFGQSLDGLLEELGLGDTSNVTPESITAASPGTKVTYSMTTDLAAALPQPRDLVVTTGVAATNLDTTSYNDTISVATGYATDVETTLTVDENKNGPSQVRIARSSAVEAPK